VIPEKATTVPSGSPSNLNRCAVFIGESVPIEPIVQPKTIDHGFDVETNESRRPPKPKKPPPLPARVKNGLPKGVIRTTGFGDVRTISNLKSSGLCEVATDRFIKLSPTHTNLLICSSALTKRPGNDGNLSCPDGDNEFGRPQATQDFVS
jgi:hypothetical protein